jgi:DNA ligase-1
LTPWFFDIVHVDGTDLIDAPLSTRIDQLEAVAGAHRVPGRITDDPDEATRILTEALERGHEGVMVKAADSTYQAGRRGKAWRKVKPVTTLDLVVLAVERGSGRRRGTLSNIHLGARDPETGRFVMVGKTFKGMTDEMLAWQTRRFTELKVEEEGHVVHVRPEQVVEVAVDGVQRSTRYPGGVALRFARVRGYRPDRDPDTADTIETVRGLL